jgi:hypothetical protein
VTCLLLPVGVLYWLSPLLCCGCDAASSSNCRALSQSPAVLKSSFQGSSDLAALEADFADPPEALWRDGLLPLAASAPRVAAALAAAAAAREALLRLRPLPLRFASGGGGPPRPDASRTPSAS